MDGRLWLKEKIKSNRDRERENTWFSDKNSNDAFREGAEWRKVMAQSLHDRSCWDDIQWVIIIVGLQTASCGSLMIDNKP